VCGFIFHKQLGKNNYINKKLFVSASKLIINRGPDNQTYHNENKYNVFHARLNIIDLKSRSNQPFKYKDLSIVYNGEIYNYKVLRKELEKNFSFKTSSDTEVLLASYIKWGEKMFKKIEGMFSFVIYNIKKNKIFFARDLFGQKPLYYSIDKNELIFSSEIKPIIKLKRIKKIRFNDREINKYLNFNYYGDDSSTFFKDIYQIKPGSFGYINNNKIITKKINSKIKINKINEKKVFNILKTEINLHLISDVEMGILISEGVDSKAILDISDKVFKKKLKLFNLEFEDFDNSMFKNNYQNKYKKRINLTKFYKKEMFGYLDEASKICEAPPLSLFTLGMIKLFKLIKKKKIKVTLNGQGIDEIFGGYHSIYKKIDINKIYHPSGEVLLKEKKIFLKKNLSQNKSKVNYKKIMLDMSFKTKIPKNLNQYDKISMNSSIENRSPYLTKNLLSIMNKLNKDQLYKNNQTKKIFRDVMYKFTKDNFYYQKKMYEQAPQSIFMLNKVNYTKIKRILKKKNICDKYFYKKNLIEYFKDFKLQKNNGFLIWQYLSLNSFINSFKMI
jgi:asparagine synthase (glutamine-hydrolysing)